jgi:hypothetical protein
VSSYSQRTLIGQAVSSFGKGVGEPAMITKVDAFTATNASYTVPVGVTYMVAYIMGGGGGAGSYNDSGAGGTSSVAFAGGTISATGGNPCKANFGGGGGPFNLNTTAGQANSGNGAIMTGSSSSGYFQNLEGRSGAYIVAGGAVTAGATLAVTVGAGGTAGTSGAAGGSGYVYLEYQVKA